LREGVFHLTEHDRTVRIESLVAGAASGRAVVLEEPLSLWGGLDPATGVIIDAHHPQHGVYVGQTILVMPSGRGSSSSSSVLVEAVRRRTNPLALLLFEADEILILAAIVAKVLYGVVVPVGLLDHERHVFVRTGDLVEINDSHIKVTRG
jgi:predicted aconitase with swiveling domain